MIFERGHFDETVIQESFVMDSLTESKSFDSISAIASEPTVFLSHKHNDLKDMKDLRGVIGALKKFGAKVYIDSIE